MVGLNAPSHLLLAPADGSPFVIDCFGRGVMSDEEAAAFVAARLGGATLDEQPALGEKQLAIGRSALAQLRASPMTTLQWGARMLRNLRAVYTQSGDIVGLLGACDRLRAIGAHSRIAVSDAEMRECSGQLALCLYAMRWEQRRAEARMLLEGLLRYDLEAAARFGSAARSEMIDRERIERLLAEPWFESASS